MILVSGSTGKVGQHLVSALKAKGATFKALTRSEASLKALAAQGVEAVKGDLGDPVSLKAALQGVDKLFLLSAGSHFGPLELGAIEAAKVAGVKNVVKLSANGASADSSNPLMRAHARAERALEASGLAFTILRPNSFMQNWVAFFSLGITAGQPVYVNAGEGRLAWIDARDIADVAATALTKPGHEGFVYDLTGSEALNYGEVADRLGRLLGREVPYVPVPDAAAFEAMKGMGMDAWYAYGMVTLHQGVRRGLAEPTTGTIELVTGKAPRSIDAFLKENIGAFS
ncbi:MAG: SDR family oxidoreductase [Deltaproteobacteria bacterium]|nr:SDR family oxidoreductase [Deltaproteobacteria bacterium]